MRDRREMLIAGLVAGGGLVTAMTALPGAGRAEDARSPRSVAERFAATLTAHDMAAFAALFADDYVNHQTSAAAPAPVGKSAKQATVAFFGARLAAMADLTVTIEALVADADRVAASFVYRGTQTGPYFGVPPTRKTLRFTSCDIFAVKDGRIVEHWGMGDIAGQIAQLRA